MKRRLQLDSGINLNRVEFPEISVDQSESVLVVIIAVKIKPCIGRVIIFPVKCQKLFISEIRDESRIPS